MVSKESIDLVCGMEVDLQAAEFKSEYNGHSYYFCSLECKSRFDAHPQIFIQNHAEANASA